MALIVADRVKESTSATGLGVISLNGTDGPFQAFSNVCAENDTVYYCMVERVGVDWEIGVGTYTTNQLARSQLLSSSTGGFVNFAAGTKDVFLTSPANVIDVITSSTTQTLLGRKTPGEGQLEQLSISEVRALLDVNLTWMSLTTTWDSTPVLSYSDASGSVYTYIQDNVTRYRYVPIPYVPTADAFYSDFDGTNVSNLIINR